MSRDEVERMLAAVPVRTLPADADAEVVTAIRYGGQSAAALVPFRPIPLWQAVAACIVFCTATWLLSGADQPSTMGNGSAAPGPVGVVVDVEGPLFQVAPSSRQTAWMYRVGGFVCHKQRSE